MFARYKNRLRCRAPLVYHRSMVIGYHLIWTAYGWWLPNDPRGSTSHRIRQNNANASTAVYVRAGLRRLAAARRTQPHLALRKTTARRTVQAEVKPNEHAHAAARATGGFFMQLSSPELVDGRACVYNADGIHDWVLFVHPARCDGWALPAGVESARAFL